MKREGFSLQYVDVMIDFIESKIKGNAITPALLVALQRRLDDIDSSNRKHKQYQRYYPHMLELQTLIYGEGNQEDKALQCLKEAVRQTGSASGLYSNLLKQYIASHIRAMPAATELSRHVAVTPERIKHKSVRRGSTMRALKVGFVTVLILAGVVAGLLHFVPRVAALPVLILHHSEISQIKSSYDGLAAQYQSCSASLDQRKGTIDSNDMAAVDAYNNDTKNCNATLQKLHQTAAQYDNMIGVAISPDKQQ